MNPELLRLIDQGLALSLWVFLGAFIFFLLYARIRMRRRRRAIGEFYAQEVAGVEAPPELDRPDPLLLNQWRIAIQSLGLALLCSVFLFLAFLFIPIPYFENFATASSWSIPPLRVTALNYDRYYEGFSLEGEVWNQTDEPMQGLTARIEVISNEGESLATVEAPVEPEVLAAGTAGSFEAEYEENSPFIKGYRLSFVAASGEPVAHVAGFDAR